MPSAELPQDLPAGLHEPLHVLEPSSGLGWIVFWVLLVSVAVLLARRRGGPPPLAAAPRPAGLPPREERIWVFDAFLAELRERHRAATDYRPALHELAAGLRRYCEEQPRGRGFSFLTAGEIAARLGGTALANVFELAAELQFGRRVPTSDDFEAVCELSREAVRKEGF